MVNIKLQEILDAKTGAVNMTRLFEISSSAQKALQVRRVVERQRHPAPAFLMPEPKSSAIVLRAANPLVRHKTKQATGILKPIFQSPTKTKKRLVKLPTARSVSVDRVTGMVSRQQKQANLQSLGSQEIRLPFFLPKVVSAGLLKKWAGQEDGTLLKKSDSGWEIINDNEEVNLQDSTQIYKLGQVEIYS